MPALKSHHFAGQHIALIVDNDEAKTAFLKAADGGGPKAASVEEPNAGYHIRGKHASVRELDQLTLEFGMAGAKWALDLVEKVLKKPALAHVPFNGAIHHADTNFKTQYTYEFDRARLTEITFPKLDVKSKELCFLKLKCQPESMNYTLAEGPPLHPGSPAKQKNWTTSAFHLSLTHDGPVKASSIGELTVKIGSKVHQVGGCQNPQYTASGKLEMPKFSFTVPMMQCHKVLAWFQKCIFKEGGAPDGEEYEQDAIIEYLDQSRKKCLYTITLKGIGPETCSVVKGTNEAPTSMKFDCYVTSMDVTPSGEGII